MFSLSIIFIEKDSEGEVCDLCKLPIEGKKWVLMLDHNDPVNFLPKPLLGTFCTPCKENYLTKSTSVDN
jgi:hypothetical protein